MKKLSPNWFVEGLNDFEYKQYVLLAYLQEVARQFREHYLYPTFSDLITHYTNLHSFKQGKSTLMESMPKNLTGIDFENLELVYDQAVEEDEQLKVIEELVDYSIPQIKAHLQTGQELFGRIENHLEIETVGLLPLYRNEGYLLLRQNRDPEIKAYEYKVSFFENAGEKYQGLQTRWVANYAWGITTTCQSIKLNLIRNQTKFPNPATFFVYSELNFPEEESLLPVMKRKFIRFLGKHRA